MVQETYIFSGTHLKIYIILKIRYYIGISRSVDELEIMSCAQSIRNPKIIGKGNNTHNIGQRRL